MRHKFGIGTIVSGALVKVKLQRGKVLGQVEEYFVSRLSMGNGSGLRANASSSCGSRA